MGKTRKVYLQYSGLQPRAGAGGWLYQVVRKELFAHLRDPAIVIRKDSITFNTACITGLEDVVYVHVMFNNDLKRIVVRGCDENDKDALRWCIAKPDKRKSRKMSCKPFAELVYKEMDWDAPQYKRKGDAGNAQHGLHHYQQPHQPFGTAGDGAEPLQGMFLFHRCSFPFTRL